MKIQLSAHDIIEKLKQDRYPCSILERLKRKRRRRKKRKKERKENEKKRKEKKNS